MNNGPRKGGASQTFEILSTVESLEHLWQNHYAVDAGSLNSPDRFIANLDEGSESVTAGEAAVHVGTAHWIKLSAQADGSFTVTNSRTGLRHDYPVR